MSILVSYLLNTMLVVIEDTILLFYSDAFLNPKRSGLMKLLSFAGFCGVQCILIFFTGEIPILKTAFGIVSAICWLRLCYSTSILRALFPAMLWIGYMMLADNVGLSIVVLLLGHQSEIFFMSEVGYYFFCFTLKIFELLGAIFIQGIFKQFMLGSHIRALDWLRLLVFPFCLLMVSVLLFRIFLSSPKNAYELLICNGILLCMDLGSILLLNFLEKEQKAEYDNSILRQSIKTELQNVNAWKNAYDCQRRQTHEFSNYLMVIEEMVRQHDSTDEVLEYINQLRRVELASGRVLRTNRAIAELIINQKSYLAESKGITFSAQLDDLSTLPLSDEALTIILSNLIDNAIEACEKIDNNEQRWIKLKLRVEEKAAFLYVENSTQYPVIIRDNLVKTSKNNATLHGYGLRNIKAVLDQYGAIYCLNYNAKTNSFSFSAQIPKHGEIG